ncbi:hypothetical protein KA977_14050, partial [Candidatus Dependentiae bacterium]|nr:hypothetical protein [Candidatus Dependentiae bacterium]
LKQTPQILFLFTRVFYITARQIYSTKADKNDSIDNNCDSFKTLKKIIGGLDSNDLQERFYRLIEIIIRLVERRHIWNEYLNALEAIFKLKDFFCSMFENMAAELKEEFIFRPVDIVFEIGADNLNQIELFLLTAHLPDIFQHHYYFKSLHLSGTAYSEFTESIWLEFLNKTNSPAIKLDILLRARHFNNLNLLKYVKEYNQSLDKNLYIIELLKIIDETDAQFDVLLNSISEDNKSFAVNEILYNKLREPHSAIVRGDLSLIRKLSVLEYKYLHFTVNNLITLPYYYKYYLYKNRNEIKHNFATDSDSSTDNNFFVFIMKYIIAVLADSDNSVSLQDIMKTFLNFGKFENSADIYAYFDKNMFELSALINKNNYKEILCDDYIENKKMNFLNIRIAIDIVNKIDAEYACSYLKTKLENLYAAANNKIEFYQNIFTVFAYDCGAMDADYYFKYIERVPAAELKFSVKNILTNFISGFKKSGKNDRADLYNKLINVNENNIYKLCAVIAILENCNENDNNEFSKYSTQLFKIIDILDNENKIRVIDYELLNVFIMRDNKADVIQLIAVIERLLENNKNNIYMYLLALDAAGFSKYLNRNFVCRLAEYLYDNIAYLENCSEYYGFTDAISGQNNEFPFIRNLIDCLVEAGFFENNNKTLQNFIKRFARFPQYTMYLTGKLIYKYFETQSDEHKKIMLANMISDIDFINTRNFE